MFVAFILEAFCQTLKSENVLDRLTFLSTDRELSVLISIFCRYFYLWIVYICHEPDMNTDGWRDRQMDRQTERKTDRQRDRQKERQTQTELTAHAHSREMIPVPVEQTV